MDIDITREEIAKLRKFGLVDETRLIYLKIQLEYDKRVFAYPDKKKGEIVDELTEEFQQRGFSVGRDTILKIVYRNISPKKSRHFVVSEL